MNDNGEFPAPRPLPHDVRERIWNQLPAADAPRRSRARFAPLAVAATVTVLVAGATVAFQSFSSDPLASAALRPYPSDPADVALTKGCVDKMDNPGDPNNWQPGAKIDSGRGPTFLLVRNSKYLGVCIVKDGKASGFIGGPDVADISGRHHYGSLTPARPFDWVNGMGYQNESIMFGIATDDVAALALVGGPANPEVQAKLENGTFIAVTRAGENSNESTTHHVRATMKNGDIINGPLRN